MTLCFARGAWFVLRVGSRPHATLRTQHVLCLILAILLGGAVQAQVPGVEHVVVIGVDGLSPDGVQKAATPHLNAMLAEGAFSMHARAVLPSSSSPNWASMLMGAGPEQHGITSNDWRLDSHLLEPTATSAEGGHFPTIFHLLRTQRPGAEALAIYDWGGFGRLFDHADVALAYDAESPEDAARRAVAEFAARQPALTFVHLDHVDGAGHGHGHGSDEYYASVVRADTLIGHMRQGLDAAGMAASTLVIVTSDHGGLGSGHGGESMAEMEIPWIAVGPGVTAGKRLGTSIDTYDTAATVAYALGLETPAAWVARPVAAVFTPAAAHERGYVPAPRIVTEGGLYVGEAPTITMTLDDPTGTAVVRYTLDGTTPTSESPAYDGPFVLDQTATVTAAAFRGGAVSAASDRHYRYVAALEAEGHGVTVAYYDGDGADWPRLPDLDAMTPVYTTTSHELDLAQIDRQADEYALRFVTTYEAPASGTYRFYTHSDDGSRLYVAGKAVVDNDGHHGPLIEQGTIDLDAGPVPLRLDYFNGGGGQFLQVYVEAPGRQRQVIPITALTPLALDARAGSIDDASREGDD